MYIALTYTSIVVFQKLTGFIPTYTLIISKHNVIDFFGRLEF